MREQKTGTNFERMLVESVQKAFSFYAWSSIDGVVEKCEMKVKAFRKDYNEIELEVKPEQYNSLVKVVSGSRILNIYVPEMSVSFSSELKNIVGTTRLKICIPKEFSFYERRTHERLRPTKTCFVNIELNKANMKKTIYDLSIGGFAIILPKSDKVIVRKGKEFPLIVLDIYGRKIKVKAECVNSINIDRFKLESLPYGGYKIAFRFMEMSKEDRNYLIEFMTHEILIQSTMKKAN